MKFKEKNAVLDEGTNSISTIYDNIQDLPSLPISSIDRERTSLVIIDMVNGFIKSGALADQKLAEIIIPIKDIANNAKNLGILSVAFIDNHTKESPEFADFPPHCLEGSEEAILIDELAVFDNILQIEKNSTNGFFEKDFQEIVYRNPQISNCIVVGCCTDICILQFCLGIKAFYNANNKKMNVIIPINAVDTYDSETHNSDFLNLTSLKIMQDTGINLVSKIEF